MTRFEGINDDYGHRLVAALQALERSPYGVSAHKGLVCTCVLVSASLHLWRWIMLQVGVFQTCPNAWTKNAT
jgi:hypothetical protein